MYCTMLSPICTLCVRPLLCVIADGRGPPLFSVWWGLFLSSGAGPVTALMAATTGVGAAAAPPTGIAAPPTVAPTRLVANASATTVTRPVGAAAASDPDEFSLPSDSPVVAAFPFLQWSRPPAGGRALVAMSELQGLCITACSFDMSDHSLLGSLRSANRSEGEFWQSLDASQLVRRASLACSQPSWVESYEGFDQPGTAAIPAVPAAAARRGQPRAPPTAPAVPAVPMAPGPLVLKFLQLTTWYAVLEEGSRQLAGMGPRRVTPSEGWVDRPNRDSADSSPSRGWSGGCVG